MKFFILILWISSLISVHCQSITLNGEWTGIIPTCGKQKSFEDCSNDTILQPFNATVPGGIYTDLHRNNIIEDNLFGRNDVNNRWVGNQSVIYTKTFNVSSDFLNAGKIILIFHGIDTFTTITLNDRELGETSNMFLRYSFDVTYKIKEGQNQLQVIFESAVRKAEKLYNQQKNTYDYVVPPVCVPEEYNGECHVNYIRKMQASFSWNWGPAFPSMGIWRDVELVSINDVWIENVAIDIKRRENHWNDWEVLVTIYLKWQQLTSSRFHLAAILHTSRKPISRVTDVDLWNEKNIQNISLIVPGDAVQNWWPNGYGEQYLYKLTVIVVTENSVARKQVRVGFRTVELVEEPLEKGLSFYFRVNGMPIFAKGSNFIPASIFPELSAKEETIRHLLLSAKEANMNMLRVWGGGVYESELFYDLADEYGIMIWQDFMFASAMYPMAYAFEKDFPQEIEQNMMRLKNHPSIVLWAGNNENEAALFGNWYGTGSAAIYRKDYVRLYVDLLKKEVERLDPTRPFLVSSPGNGALEETYNYIGVDPYWNLFGDVHYYNYLRNGWNITQYPRTRFCSAYGFQSWPSMYTINTAVESAKDDLHMNSDFVKHRQHLLFGNQFMKLLISRNFIIPQSNDSVRDFASYVYLSQINQAVSMRIQTESYRQARSEVNSIGEGMTMGALYWHLNDVWQAPSWSSIDIEGRWKMLHYYAKDFFAPLIVTSHLSNSNKLSIYIVSDQLNSLSNCTVEIRYYNWKSITPLSARYFKNITTVSNKAIKVAYLRLDESLDQVGCGSWESAKRSCVITLSLMDKSPIAPINYVYPGPLRNADIPVANVTINDVRQVISGRPYETFKFVLSTDNIALFVWLETGIIRGHFSENGFHMFETEKSIIFHPYEETTVELLQKYTTLTTLSDIYNARDNFDEDYSVLEKQEIHINHV